MSLHPDWRWTFALLCKCLLIIFVGSHTWHESFAVSFLLSKWLDFVLLHLEASCFLALELCLSVWDLRTVCANVGLIRFLDFIIIFLFFGNHDEIGSSRIYVLVSPCDIIFVPWALHTLKNSVFKHALLWTGWFWHALNSLLSENVVCTRSRNLSQLRLLFNLGWDRQSLCFFELIFMIVTMNWYRHGLLLDIS